MGVLSKMFKIFDNTYLRLAYLVAGCHRRRIQHGFPRVKTTRPPGPHNSSSIFFYFLLFKNEIYLFLFHLFVFNHSKTSISRYWAKNTFFNNIQFFSYLIFFVYKYSNVKTFLVKLLLFLFSFL